MATHQLLFDLGGTPTTRDVANLVKDGGVAALPDARRRGDAATYQEIRCRSALNRCKGMPFMKWTPQSLSRLHARLPLLLRAQISIAPRARRRRSVRVGDLREDQLRRGAAARARQAVVDEGEHRLRHRDRSVSADRRHLQDLARRDRSAARRRNAGRHRHQGTDDRARHRRAAGPVRGRNLPRAHERADGGRRRVGETRARRRAPDAAAQGGPPAGRCRD